MFLLLCVLLLFSGCSGKNTGAAQSAADNAVEDAATIAAEAERAAKERASLIAGSLDDRRLAAQVIISGIDGKGQLPQYMQDLLTECPAGGVMLFRYNLDTDNEAIQNLIAETAALIVSENGIPPFAAIDHEGGAVNRFRRGVADLPPAASYWDAAQNADNEIALAQINADSINAGTVIKRLGFNLNLAPVAEYINQNNRDFLEDRSYGADPFFAAAAAAAFIAGMEQVGVLCAVKHFPGSAGADPHRFPSILRGNKTALKALAAPFASLIQDGYARAIMVSHSMALALDGNIASLSPVIMDKWLRQEWGFEGIIICDDFSMAAANDSLNPATAAVRSLAAGADMVLVWPPDIRRTHRAIMAALDNGELSRERLQEAAARIIFEKIRLGIMD